MKSMVRNWMARWMGAILIFGHLIGCSNASKTPDDTVVVGFEAMPATLDPRFATDAYSQWVTSLIFSALVRVNRHLEPEPEAAETFEMTGPSTYIFRLRQGLTFHDGRPITAEDIAWSIKNYIDPAVASPLAAAFKKIKTIKILDKGTIKLILDQPFAPFLLDLPLLKILPKEAGSPPSQEFAQRPIGSGPFRFVEMTSDRVDLERVSHQEGLVPKMRGLVVQDSNTRFLKLKQGELDLVLNAIDRQLLPALKKLRGVQLVSEPGITYQYLVFNFRDPTLADRRVRQAIAHAINREEIIQHLLAGYATPATSVLAPSHPFFTKNLPPYPYDPRAAKKLLDEAGLKDPDGDGPQPRLTLEYKTSNAQEATDLARVIKDQLQLVGIAVTVKSYEWGTFYRDLQNGNFQIASSRLVGVVDPDIYYDIFHSSRIPPTGRNRGFYKNPALDRLLEKGRVTVDFPSRKAIYDQIQGMVARDLPYLNLWYNNNVAAFRQDIKGFQMYPNGSYLFLTDLQKTP